MEKGESRYSKEAERIVKEKRIVQLNPLDGGPPIFIFLAKEKGTHRDHLVTYNSCDCEFFLFSTILGSGKPCIHMEAYRLASEKEDFLRISARSDDFKQILTEVFAYGKSLKLRKLISSRYD